MSGQLRDPSFFVHQMTQKTIANIETQRNIAIDILTTQSTRTIGGKTRAATFSFLSNFWTESMIDQSAFLTQYYWSLFI